MRVRRSVSLAASLLVLAVPAAAPAQTPGDEQYVDPFGGDQGGGGSQPDQGTQEPEPTPAPSEPDSAAVAPEPAAPAPAEAESAQELPRTGADEGLVALAGGMLLAGGVALRLRLR